MFTTIGTPPRGFMSISLRSIVSLGAVVVSLAAVPAVALAQSETSPPFPPPGKLVDIGGWRLHINCVGPASPSGPTVILEPGIGDFSVEWSLVQPGVAKFARVCSYDRAGDGWSDLGPDPRTFHQIAYELHTLLDKAGEHPPFVLAGHSYGGWLIRTYQSVYPTEVAGLVLVDAGATDPWRMTPNGLVRSSSLAKGSPVPAVKTTGPLRESDLPPGVKDQIMRSTRQAVMTANEAPRDQLPPEAKAMRTWALGRWQHAVAANNPFESDELVALSKATAGKEYPLGDLPLFVLTRGIAEDSGPDSKAFEAEHREEHLAVSKLSRSGRLIVADRSGHHIQIQQPDLVIQAIRDVVSVAARR